MREHLTAKNGWIGLAAGVAAFDILCPKGETLSEGMDKLLQHDKWRYAAIGATAITAAHLLNVLPERVDPFHRLTSFK